MLTGQRAHSGWLKATPCKIPRVSSGRDLCSGLAVRLSRLEGSALTPQTSLTPEQIKVSASSAKDCSLDFVTFAGALKA